MRITAKTLTAILLVITIVMGVAAYFIVTNLMNERITLELRRLQEAMARDGLTLEVERVEAEPIGFGVCMLGVRFKGQPAGAPALDLQADRVCLELGYKVALERRLDTLRQLRVEGFRSAAIEGMVGPATLGDLVVSDIRPPAVQRLALAIPNAAGRDPMVVLADAGLRPDQVLRRLHLEGGDVTLLDGRRLQFGPTLIDLSRPPSEGAAAPAGTDPALTRYFTTQPARIDTLALTTPAAEGSPTILSLEFLELSGMSLRPETGETGFDRITAGRLTGSLGEEQLNWSGMSLSAVPVGALGHGQPAAPLIRVLPATAEIQDLFWVPVLPPWATPADGRPALSVALKTATLTSEKKPDGLGISLQGTGMDARVLPELLSIVLPPALRAELTIDDRLPLQGGFEVPLQLSQSGVVQIGPALVTLDGLLRFGVALTAQATGDTDGTRSLDSWLTQLDAGTLLNGQILLEDQGAVAKAAANPTVASAMPIVTFWIQNNLNEVSGTPSEALYRGLGDVLQGRGPVSLSLTPLQPLSFGTAMALFAAGQSAEGVPAFDLFRIERMQ